MNYKLSVKQNTSLLQIMGAYNQGWSLGRDIVRVCETRKRMGWTWMDVSDSRILESLGVWNRKRKN